MAQEVFWVFAVSIGSALGLESALPHLDGSVLVQWVLLCMGRDLAP